MSAGELETVTILITDLVGSTALASRVGPLVSEELRQEHFGLLREVIGESGGREVKSTGDGLMAAFGSAAAALCCAVSAQQRFEWRNRSASEPLLIKVGVSSGDATIADDDVFGMPVVEAARLCDRCSSGQILAKELLTHLTRGRGHELKAVGALELKGLPAAIDAVEVVWEPLGSRAALPELLRELPATAFVGREAERERMGGLWTQARGGSLRVALISGEPGVGKTRLSTHLALAVHGDGATVLYGRCDEDLGVPYQPWVQALGHLVKEAPQSILDDHVERYGGDLARIVPALADRVAELPSPRQSDPETERYIMYAAVVGLLQGAGKQEPLLLILDDLHWADAPTLSLLRHIVKANPAMRVMVVGAYRDSELAHDHPLKALLAVLHGEPGVERAKLTGLDVEDVLALMEAAAGHELDEDGRALAVEITRETAGNPFFTGELLRHLAESGALVQQDGTHWRLVGGLAQLGLPQSVREVIGQRVERLGPDARTALSAAAVIGRDFDLDLLLATVELPEGRLLDLLEQAAVASLLQENSARAGRFAFTHALVEHTLYEDLGATRSAVLHRQVAQALEEQCGDEPGERLGELAGHWAAAVVSADTEKAMHYARRAAERALEKLAPAEAVRWYCQALELYEQAPGGDDFDRCELLIGLGEAQRQTGEPAYCETLLEASRLASGLEDADRAARAALANNRGINSVIGEVDAERIRAIERALKLDDPPHPARRARLLALQALELAWDPDFARRKALADEAVSLARATGDTRTLAEVLSLAYYAYQSAETLELRTALVEELSDCASSLRDPALHFWVHDDEVVVSIERGDFARVQVALEHMQRIAKELGQPTLRWIAAFVTAGWELMRGDLGGAESLVERALQIGQETGEPDAILVYGAQLAYTRTYQGRPQEIIAMLEQSVSAYPGIPAWKAAVAQVLGWLDRGAEAAVILERAASDRFEHVAPEPAKSTALALYAEAAAQTGDPAAACILYELIEPWSDQIVWNGSTGWGHARMWLGLLAAVVGRHDEADQHLEFACEFQETNGLLLWATRAHLGWAQALADRGETARACEHAARALELSRDHGYGLFEARAAALLQAQSAAQA